MVLRSSLLPTAVKHQSKALSGHRVRGADGYDPCGGFAPVGVWFDGDVDTFANHIEHGPRIRCTAERNDALRAIDTDRQSFHYTPNLFKDEGFARLITPRSERLREIVFMPVGVWASLDRATTRVLVAERSSRAACIKSTGRQQDIKRHLSPHRLDQPKPAHSILQPTPDAIDPIPVDEIDLVENKQIRERNLEEFKFHQFWSFKNLIGVDHARDAVEPDMVTNGRVGECNEKAGRLCHAAGLKHDVLRPFGARHHLPHGVKEIIPN